LLQCIKQAEQRDSSYVEYLSGKIDGQGGG